MAAEFAPVYFADENLPGFARLLRERGREDILFPGQENHPEVPLGALDLDWMPTVSRRDFIVITRDRRIRTRPAEVLAYRELGIRSLWMGGKVDLSPLNRVELFLEHEPRLRRQIVKLGPGPWSLALTPSGIRPLRSRTDVR